MVSIDGEPVRRPTTHRLLEQRPETAVDAAAELAAFWHNNLKHAGPRQGLPAPSCRARSAPQMRRSALREMPTHEVIRPEPFRQRSATVELCHDVVLEHGHSSCDDVARVHLVAAGLQEGSDPL